jgi:hypothetical protein
MHYVSERIKLVVQWYICESAKGIWRQSNACNKIKRWIGWRPEVSPGFGIRDSDSKSIGRNVLLASPVAALGLLCLSFRARWIRIPNPEPGANFMTLTPWHLRIQFGDHFAYEVVHAFLRSLVLTTACPWILLVAICTFSLGCGLVFRTVLYGRSTWSIC